VQRITLVGWQVADYVTAMTSCLPPLQDKEQCCSVNKSVPPQLPPVLQVSVVTFVTCHFICYLSFHLSLRVVVGLLTQSGL
jgi:hypothetical protein